LNKPETDPGIKRGDCPGGEESTPTYLRKTYPNGYVTFKNAAVGEIGSTLLQPDPNAPTPVPAPGSCGCGSADGTNQPECIGSSESTCKHMMNNEGKCKWTDCVQPTAAPIPPAPTPTPPAEGCYSHNYKDCIPDGYTSSSCDKVWLPNGAEENCVALWGDCSGMQKCCGPASCFGGIANAKCVPPASVTSNPTSAPPMCSKKGEFCEKNSDCCKNKCKKKKNKCQK